MLWPADDREIASRRTTSAGAHDASQPATLRVNTIDRVRRQLLALARTYRAGGCDYDSFAEGILGLADYRVEPYAQALVDLVEHEPVVGRWLGVTPEEHAAYRARLEQTITDLLAEPWARRAAGGPS